MWWIICLWITAKGLRHVFVTFPTQRPGQALELVGGDEGLRQLSDVQFEDTRDHVHFRPPQPGYSVTQIWACQTHDECYQCYCNFSGHRLPSLWPQEKTSCQSAKKQQLDIGSTGQNEMFLQEDLKCVENMRYFNISTWLSFGKDCCNNCNMLMVPRGWSLNDFGWSPDFSCRANWRCLVNSGNI